MRDLEIERIDHKRKLKDDKEESEYKATLKNELGYIKLTIKRSTKEALKNDLGVLKVGQKVQMDLTNNQTTLDEVEND